MGHIVLKPLEASQALKAWRLFQEYFNYYLYQMTITTAISRAREKLIERYKKSGLYENFGQKEVRRLEEKYINISEYTEEMNRRRDELQEFNEWCMTLMGNYR